MSRLKPLPKDAQPELADAFQAYVKSLGFVPNSVLILQRRPKIVKALAQLASAIWDPQGEVPVGFKRLLAYVASKTHGCHY